MLTINDILQANTHTPIGPDHIGRVVAAWDDDSAYAMRGYLQYIKYDDNGKVYGFMFEDSKTNTVVEYKYAALLNDEQCKQVICKEGTCYIIARTHDGNLLTTIGIRKPEELIDFNWETIKNAIKASHDE